MRFDRSFWFCYLQAARRLPGIVTTFDVALARTASRRGIGAECLPAQRGVTPEYLEGLSWMGGLLWMTSTIRKQNTTPSGPTRFAFSN